MNLRRFTGRIALVLVVQTLLAPPSLLAQTAGSAEEQLLEMSLQELLSLPVEAATRTRVSYLAVPQAVSVLTRAEIERLPALTLPDLLRFLPGANVVRAQSSQQIVSARGSNAFTPSKLLILVDGQPVDTTLFSTTWWELVPISVQDVERIEMIRSPGTIYGANAQNGVINIVTRQLPETAGEAYRVEARAVAGQQDLRQSYVSLLGRVGSASYRVSFEAGGVDAYENDRRLEIVPGRPSPPGEQTFAASREQLDLRNLSGSLHGTLAGNPLAVNVGLKDIRNAQGRLPDRLCFVGLDGEVGYASVTYGLQPGAVHHELSLAADRIEFEFHRNSDTRALAPAGMTLARYSLGYEAQRRIGEAHNLLLGASATLQDAANDSGVPFFTGERVDLEPTFDARLQDEWQLGARDRLYLGGLVSDHYVAGTSVSPLLAWVHTWNDRHSLRAATFTSHRNPGVFEHSMDYDQSTGEADKVTRLVSNRDLDAERTTSYELGVRSQPRANLFLFADLYMNQVERGVEWTLDGVERVPVARPRYRSENTLEQEILGVETGFKTTVAGRVTFEGNVTLAEVSNTTRRGTAAQASRYGEDYVPPYITNAIVGFDWPRVRGFVHYQHVGSHTWIWPSWNASSGLDRPTEKPVPDYGLLAAQIAFPITRNITAAVAGQNLLDDLHTEWRGDTSYFGRQVWFSLGVGF
ncbi:MAG TPA: TonB-dependent receptor [Thermoanaerobaculia bacterium]|nr:TonB-dependent receptor [Thermoanaerobaculia bacterium]